MQETCSRSRALSLLEQLRNHMKSCVESRRFRDITIVPEDHIEMAVSYLEQLGVVAEAKVLQSRVRDVGDNVLGLMTIRPADERLKSSFPSEPTLANLSADRKRHFTKKRPSTKWLTAFCLKRRARDSNSQPLTGHLISNEAASHSLTLRAAFLTCYRLVASVSAVNSANSPLAGEC